MLKKQKAKEETETEVEAENVVMVVVTERDVMVDLEVTDALEGVLVTEEVLTEETEEVLIVEVLMVLDQDVLTDLGLVIPVLETEVKEEALMVQGPDVQLLLVRQEVLKDPDPDVLTLNLLHQAQTDLDVRDVS
jgi:hypothetical protein